MNSNYYPQNAELASRHTMGASLVLTLLLSLVSSFSLAQASGEASDAEIRQWASDNLHEVSLTATDLSDLEPLRNLIGDARMVSLGEGLHGSAEPLEFRNRLFQFLVEELGFTAIALESGFTESYVANTYVQGGPGDAPAIAATGITHGMGGYPQQAELLQWMRTYNAEPEHSPKLEFYGMDISASPAEPHSALDTALDYLDDVAPQAADQFRERIEPFRPLLKINRQSAEVAHYADLPAPQRDAVTAAIADLVLAFEINEIAFSAATSDREYALAHRAAVAAQQTDEYLRQFPVGWTPEQGPAAAMSSVAVADIAKTDNVEWILAQQRPNGKLLIFAHHGHVATTSVSIQLPGRAEIQLPTMLGEFLKPRFGLELITIGHLLGHDRTGCGEPRPAAAPDTLEGILAATQSPAFILGLATAPPGVKQRLLTQHNLYGQRPVHSLNIGLGIDMIFFTEHAVPAIACLGPAE